MALGMRRTAQLAVALRRRGREDLLWRAEGVRYWELGDLRGYTLWDDRGMVVGVLEAVGGSPGYREGPMFRCNVHGYSEGVYWCPLRYMNTYRMSLEGALVEALAHLDDDRWPRVGRFG